MNPSVDDAAKVVSYAIELVCGVTFEQICSPSHQRRLAEARQLFSSALRSYGHSYLRIGNIMVRDHSTIIHQCQRDEADTKYCKAYRETKEQVYKLIKQQKK